MKNKKIFILLILIAAVVGGGVYIIRHQGSEARQPEVYYCPMHPTYTSDRPSDCPICNMKLVKKETTAQMPDAQQADKHRRDICLMHDCHKKLGGKPCPMMVVAKEGETVTCPICGTYIVKGGKLAAKKLLYWTDPMIPGYKSDKPGKCPKCGMEMKKI